LTEKAIIRWIENVNKNDVSEVGGKAANLGEMLKVGFPVPWAFVITTAAYQKFLNVSGLVTEIQSLLSEIDMELPDNLQRESETIRELIMSKTVPEDIKREISENYVELSKKGKEEESFVAVRSSAVSEDSKFASFAGQQETYLNVKGAANLIESVKKCWASLYTPRAIFYRKMHKIDNLQAQMSVVVQMMVDAETAGIAFTAHPTTNDTTQILIEACYGLGETIASGRITPDEFIVDKETFILIGKTIADKRGVMRTRDPATGKTVEVYISDELRRRQSITDDCVIQIAQISKKIEDYYNFPQDIEWVQKDGSIFIVQTRPITTFKLKEERKFEIMDLKFKKGEIVVKGLGASPGMGIGPVNVVLESGKATKALKEGDVLITKMTNPDWVPYMKIASAIITDEGGMTCHAAIISREMGIPCIVGTHNSTEIFQKMQGVTVSVDGSRGVVYFGDVSSEVKEEEGKQSVTHVIQQPITATKIYVNLSIPEIAQKIAKETQADGVGLLRAEHLMLSTGKHPRKLIEEGGSENMVNTFANGIRQVAEAFYPKPIVYRFLDFKPDEFLGLEGGKIEEELGHVGPNPLIGYRGAFRYRKEPDIFRLECRAIKKVRERYGLKNVNVMIPFVRTIEDITETYTLMKDEGLQRGPDFKLWIMVEVPSAGIIIDKLIETGIDGVSFGTNDFTMTILGADRDDASIQEIYDERNLAVLRLISHVIRYCKNNNVTTSICGQAPSVYPEYCEFMVRQGATSISVNPDAVISSRRLVASIEQKIILERSLEDIQQKTAWEPKWDSDKIAH
jgi:pyruvate,water dikinase